MRFFTSFFGGREEPEFLVTDVTRMQGNRLCIAGMRGKSVVRLAEPSPTSELVASFGGLSPGDVLHVDARPARRYRPPHTEDHDWAPKTLVKTDHLAGPHLFARLANAAFPSVVKAYGEPVYFSAKGNPVFPSDRGQRSLATVAAHTIRLYRYGDGIRCDFSDNTSEWRMLPVEGVAIHLHFRECPVCSDAGELRIPQAVLRVGLGRPFKPDNQELGCFAQVNSVITPTEGLELHEGAHP